MLSIGENIHNIEVRIQKIGNKIVRIFAILAPYSKDHPIIQAFWRCVHEFTEDQKRKLLKFTTSCSRPPLFGFKVSRIWIFEMNSFLIELNCLGIVSRILYSISWLRNWSFTNIEYLYKSFEIAWIWKWNRSQRKTSLCYSSSCWFRI